VRLACQTHSPDAVAQEYALDTIDVVAGLVASLCQGVTNLVSSGVGVLVLGNERSAYSYHCGVSVCSVTTQSPCGCAQVSLSTQGCHPSNLCSSNWPAQHTTHSHLALDM